MKVNDGAEDECIMVGILLHLLDVDVYRIVSCINENKMKKTSGGKKNVKNKHLVLLENRRQEE